MSTPGITRHWRTLLVAVALVAATAGGAGARAAFDANNARKVGGYTHTQMSTMSIAPQAMTTMGSTETNSFGPVLEAIGVGSVAVSFVVPRDHDPAKPLTMRLSYTEFNAGACSWDVDTYALFGPTGPNTATNVDSGGWRLPGTSATSGLISVPAGQGSAHAVTLSWPHQDNPGMFIGMQLARNGSAGGDTCSDVQITGIRVAY